MPDLERELRELRVAWPDTPDLAAAVSERLAAAPAPRAPRRPLAWPAWRIAVAAVAVLIAVVMAVPPARSAVLEWIGISSVQIERREPRPSRFGADLNLGRPVTLEQARRRAGFPVGVPAALGEPDAVYFSPDPAARTRVDFVYRPRPGLPRASTTGAGLLVTQLRASAEPAIQKTIGASATLERLRVDGDPAYFISGSEHGFAYLAEGSMAFEPQRLAGNTLLVDRADGVLLRVEGELSRAEAIRIAASVR